MYKNNLRRDTLDYILTDATPVEISELFTYTYLYNYLHKNKKALDGIVSLIKSQEVDVFKDVVPFKGNSGRNWTTTPLTFNIVKADGKSLRKMSVPQPLSALNMYCFIALYQKDILRLLEKPAFSVRYQTRNSDLIYKSKGRTSLIDYQYKRNRRSKKVVEQTGRFFDIGPFNQVVDLTRSEQWRQANLKFKLFCKLDYKRCFDSIYTHSYKWIVTRDIVDSKEFNNSSLFAVIDRILQNINGASSNGVIVGPEFSRMIVEILLQQIDHEVYSELLNNGMHRGTDYEIMRFVDDTFLFTNNEIAQDRIIEIIETKARSYLLEINQLKIDKQSTPYFRADWVNDIEVYKDKVLKVLRTNKVVEQSGESFQVASSVKDIRNLKDAYGHLVGKYKADKITLSNYIMSVFMNNMSSKNRKYTFFRTTTHKSIFALLDCAFYIYCYAINFKNTQKLISILYYCHNEANLKSSKDLQAIVHKYESVIMDSNYNDMLNLLVVFDELGIHFSLEFEEKLFASIKTADDPIALATFLYYSKYNSKLMDQVSREVGAILDEKYNSIQDDGKELLYREFWYVLIFNKCPYIGQDTQNRFNGMLKKMTKPTSSHAGQAMKMIAEYMLDKNEDYSFISWNAKGARMLEEITYRTQNKTIFRKGAPGFLTSL